VSATTQPATPSAASAARREYRLSAATRDSWSAFWRSRVLVWATGALALLVYGVNASIRATFDPGGISSSLGSVGNVLAAPAVRWDAIWYLHLARHGYHTLQDTGFFPLYPLLIRVASWPLRSTVVAGIGVSMVATLIGLVIVHRLTELEVGSRPAATSVKLLAFAPFAFYLSAVYTEGVFLALSAGTFYAARKGRWALAGILGGLASMSRVTGVVLIAPVLLLYLYGPREGLAGANPLPVRARGRAAALASLAPRYALRAQLLWSLLIPAGLAAFCAYTALRGFGFTATFRAQHTFWQHQFKGPLTGAWDGLVAAWHELKALLEGNTAATYRSPAILQLGVLVASVLALIGVFRRLPIAYGTYVLLGLLVPLSSPTAGDPLRGLDRYASMMFPLFMWAGAWASGTRRARPLLIISGVLLAGFTIQFVTWHIVGTVPS